jgi:hypothetical protein
VIPSPFHSARGSKPVRLVIVHSAEGARTVESLGRWFQRPATKASSHAGIDDTRIEQYVRYDRAAWTTRAPNAISDNVELCGFAKWTRDEWLAHPHMLQLCAQWISDRCIARTIPIRKLTPVEVAAGKAGVCGHVDWTVGMRDGTHQDPGPRVSVGPRHRVGRRRPPSPCSHAEHVLRLRRPLRPGHDPAEVHDLPLPVV